MTERNILDVLSSYLPEYWMEKNLNDPLGYKEPFKLRPFQEEIVGAVYNDKHRKFSFAIARQTGKSVVMAAIALHRAIVLKRHVVIITPSENQINTLWEKILGCFRYNDDINNLVKISRSKPFHYLEFASGGSIKGLISGTDNARESVTLRGFSGDDIFIDEASYIPESAWKIITPFFTNTLDYKWVLTSTPSPFEDYFYSTHHDPSMGFITLSYPAPIANPMWNEDMEKQNKETMTPDEYDREILAKFPTQAGGVFSPEAIQKAMKNYQYSLTKRDGYRYCMGVDWNTAENGTQICILGYAKNNIYVAYREIISNITNHQTKSLERIIELHRAIRCDHIFVDEGYGAAQIELLKEYGMMHPETGIFTKLIPMDFNNKNTIRVKIGNTDPQPKPAKSFMVGLLQKLLQDGMFEFSSLDTHKITALQVQLRNFKVKKKSFGNVPTYADGYYHGIISVMIAILGLYKLYATYSADRVSANGSFVPFDSSRESNVFNNNNKEHSVMPTVDEMMKRDQKYVDFNNFLREQPRYIQQGLGRANNTLSPRSPDKLRRRG